jgi:hypothetical protein
MLKDMQNLRLPDPYYSGAAGFVGSTIEELHQDMAASPFPKRGCGVCTTACGTHTYTLTSPTICSPLLPARHFRASNWLSACASEINLRDDSIERGSRARPSCGIRGRGGTIFCAALPSKGQVQADMRTHLIHRIPAPTDLDFRKRAGISTVAR